MKDTRKLEIIKNEFIQVGLDLLNEMYETDACFLNNYPDYLPSFDEFISDFMDVEFK